MAIPRLKLSVKDPPCNQRLNDVDSNSFPGRVAVQIPNRSLTGLGGLKCQEHSKGAQIETGN